MIVTGGSSMKKNGFIDKAIEELKKGGMTAEVFDGVEPNPSVNTVKKVLKQCSNLNLIG